MTAIADPLWHHHAAGLADALAATGDLTDPAWHTAVRDTPRHTLVPQYYDRRARAWRALAGSTERQDTQRWLGTVYSSTELDIKIDHDRCALSQATAPGLLARLLELLDVRDGHRVFEVGTGSGYLTALLCHRVGDKQVCSVDVQHDLILAASTRLEEIGYRPWLRVGDGRWGVRPQPPFDRIVSTCAVPTIPSIWLRQLNPGGVIVTDFRIAPFAGNLVRLETHDGQRLEGRFRPTDTAFAPIRNDLEELEEPARWLKRSKARRRTRYSTVEPGTMWKAETSLVWFLTALQFGEHAPYTDWEAEDSGTSRSPAAIWLTSPDGSWAAIDPQRSQHGHKVTEAGPQRLWEAVENAHQLWCDLDQPGWDRIGLTVTRHRHTIWIDHPDGPHRWTRPTRAAASDWTKATSRSSRQCPAPAREHRE